ncbi:MAG: D-aminoacylase [Trueperaceae bacterium]|nr:D-aminoacylase [Trueperaceae bacterium]
MPHYDTLIRHGRVVDGTGNPWVHADVALVGDRIAAIAHPGRLDPAHARSVVDATGHVVAPGFIDIQSHAILPLMIDGRCLSKITQGVTTEVMGEAWTPSPVVGRHTEPLAGSLFEHRLDPVWGERAATWTRFGDWLRAMEDHGVSPNVGSFLGGGTLRTTARGMDMGPSSPEELAAMRQVLAEAMEDGAFGASYALIYPPDAYAGTEELIDVCRAMAPYGGVYVTHLRSESTGIFEALEEALRIGRDAGVPVEVYHLKAAHPDAWYRMPSVIERIHRARADGQDVTADMYPYAASGTGLTAILPTWTAEGGRLYENLRDPGVRARVRATLEGRGEPGDVLGADGLGLETRGGPHGIMPVGFRLPEHQAYVGLRLDEIAALRGQDWIEATLDLLVAEGQRIGTIFFSMDEANLRLQVQQPWIKFATDAGGFDPAWAKANGPVHPRGYGTYPRVLRTYVREERLITLEDAVRKMTSAVADRLSLRDRGQLREGFHADVVVFDPETIGDRATFEDPHQLSVGVRDVWVNGVRVLEDGAHTGATPGRFVKGPGA